jgi:diguanylate cyclase (GGDEF)-like protein
MVARETEQTNSTSDTASTERSPYNAEDFLKVVLDNFPGGISFIDENLRVVLHNKRFLELLDFPDALFRGHPSFDALLRFNAQRGEYGPGDVEEHVAVRMALAKERKPHVFERVRPDGRVLEVRGVPIAGGGFITTYLDITERRQAEARVAYLARHDELTDLANRALLGERLDQALARVKRGDVLAVHLLDLDRFKAVNDALGHPAGDKLLRMVADRLRAEVREIDTIARMGGDEFAILQVAISAPNDAFLLAQRIIDALGKPFDIDGHPAVIGTSVGIAMARADDPAHGELLRNADLALYRAKSEGRGTYCVFEAEMEAELLQQNAMGFELRAALSTGQFQLYYQPVVNIPSNRITSFEVVLRWLHPNEGIIMPDAFIPLAEEMGFIIPLGEWVLKNACAAAAKWPSHIKISVNISPMQFRHPGFVHMVIDALTASCLQPDRLELEIAESTLQHDNAEALSALYQLRELGVGICMDDFGTGCSSLSHLQRFPFDKLKIDRSFVKDISDHAGSLNIVRAIAGLAHSLGIATTAEGVETKEQLDAVRSEGCVEVRGCLFGKPLPADDIERLLLDDVDAGRAEPVSGAA